jgi:hypothetical protein
MGCGCGKKGVTRGRRRTLAPSVGPRSIKGGTAAGPSPQTVRALGLQTSTSVRASRQMDENRRRIEKLRREAIKRRLGR